MTTKGEFFESKLVIRNRKRRKKAPWTSRQDEEKMIKRKGEWSERRKRDYIAGCTTNVADDDKMIDDDGVVVDDENEDEGDAGCRKREIGRKKEEKDIYNILLTTDTPIYKTLFRDV